MGRVATAVIGEPDVTVDEVREDLVAPRFDMSTDTAIVIDAAGQVRAYAQAYDEHDERGYVDVYVDPQLDDQPFAEMAGHATAAALDRLREALRQRNASQTDAAAGLYRGESRMLQAYIDAGFRQDRVYWRMKAGVEAMTDAHVQLPPGVTVRQVDPDDDFVVATALGLRNESMRHHHGNVEKEFDAFAENWRSGMKYDRDAWWFAELDGEPVGLLLGNNSKVDEDAGYVQTLGVLERARGRGIARALLLTSFGHYRRRGRTGVLLGVDSSNDTGATRLYESVGMKTVLAIDALVCPLYV